MNPSPKIGRYIRTNNMVWLKCSKKITNRNVTTQKLNSIQIVFFFRFSAGFCFTVVYAALLTKTNRIARIFKAGKKSGGTLNYISPRSQLIICTGLVAIQVRNPINFTIVCSNGLNQFCCLLSIFPIQLLSHWCVEERTISAVYLHNVRVFAEYKLPVSIAVKGIE